VHVVRAVLPPMPIKDSKQSLFGVDKKAVLIGFVSRNLYIVCLQIRSRLTEILESQCLGVFPREKPPYTSGPHRGF
jgi:hypothetical protein